MSIRISDVYLQIKAIVLDTFRAERQADLDDNIKWYTPSFLERWIKLIN